MSFRCIQYLRPLFAALIPLALFGACSFGDSYGDCGLYLHFTYEYNMAAADASREIDRIDLLVFDADGTYLFTETAGREELGRTDYTLPLHERLSPGTYMFLVWGGLSDDFRLSDVRSATADLQPGKTRLEDVRLTLTRVAQGVCDAELHPVWYAAPRTIAYDPGAGRRTHTIDLMKDTNRFRISLTEEGTSRADASSGGRSPYTFEIVSAGHEAYDADNRPVGADSVSFLPYRISGDLTGAAGELNTMRLLEDVPLPSGGPKRVRS